MTTNATQPKVDRAPRPDGEHCGPHHRQVEHQQELRELVRDEAQRVGLHVEKEVV